MLCHKGTQTLKTNRLILRKFEFIDVDHMLKNWISDPAVQSLLSEPTYSTKEEVNVLLTKYIGSYVNEQCYRWAIVLQDSDECIGQIAFFLVDNKNHFAEIEYCIGSKHQNKGLATEATKELIRFGFRELNFHKIQICHKSINIPSKRVIEKCGFVYEGTLRDYFYMDGNYVDRLYYSILQREFYSHTN